MTKNFNVYYKLVYFNFNLVTLCFLISSNLKVIKKIKRYLRVND